MKLLIDMNLTRRWVEALTLAGFEAVHWSTGGPGNAPDPEIMSYARSNDLVVLTQDLDFGAILALTHGDKPSVMQIRADDTSPDVIGAQVTSPETDGTGYRRGCPVDRRTDRRTHSRENTASPAMPLTLSRVGSACALDGRVIGAVKAPSSGPPHRRVEPPARFAGCS